MTIKKTKLDAKRQISVTLAKRLLAAAGLGEETSARLARRTFSSF